RQLGTGYLNARRARGHASKSRMPRPLLRNISYVFRNHVALFALEQVGRHRSLALLDHVRNLLGVQADVIKDRTNSALRASIRERVAAAAGGDEQVLGFLVFCAAAHGCGLGGAAVAVTAAIVAAATGKRDG